MDAIKEIKISKDKLLALLLFLLLWFFNSKVGVELKFIVVVLFGALFMLKKLKTYTSLFYALLPLATIFFVAFISSFFFRPTIYDFIKDVVYMVKPIATILLGCYFVFSFRNKDWVLKGLVYFCFFSALSHIYILYTNLDGEWDTALVRLIGGKGSDFEAFVYSLFLVYIGKKDLHLFSKRFKISFIIVVSISILLYLSRTTFLAVGIFLISFYGFTQFNRKQIIYLLGLFVFSVSFMVTLQFLDIDRGSTGIESFFYKLKIAPSEVFNAEINVEDHTQLWDKWRAYEVKKTFETMENTDSVLPYISGMGLGSLVDLGFEAPLGAERMQYIPHIHNGYAYVIFKSGLIGLILLLIWLLYLYAYIYKKTNSLKHRIFNRAISGLSLYLLFSTLVITGIYNLSFTLSLILGLMLGLGLFERQNQLNVDAS